MTIAQTWYHAPRKPFPHSITHSKHVRSRNLSIQLPDHVMINTTTCKARQAASAGNALFWRRSISANSSSTNYSYIICWRNLGKWQPAAWGSCEEPLGVVACSEEEGCAAEASASSRCLCCSAFLSLSRCRPLRIIANSGPINSDKQRGRHRKGVKRQALSNQYIEQRGGVGGLTKETSNRY